MALDIDAAMFIGGRLQRLRDFDWQLHRPAMFRSISHIYRYLGHTLAPYSVADHSLVVSYLAAADAGLLHARAALLHDVGEAIVGDVTRPMKRLLGAEWAQAHQEVEHAVLREVFEAEQLDFDLLAEVKRYDDAVGEIEKSILFSPAPFDRDEAIARTIGLCKNNGDPNVIRVLLGLRDKVGRYSGSTPAESQKRIEARYRDLAIAVEQDRGGRSC